MFARRRASSGHPTFPVQLNEAQFEACEAGIQALILFRTKITAPMAHSEISKTDGHQHYFVGCLVDRELMLA